MEVFATAGVAQWTANAAQQCAASCFDDRMTIRRSRSSNHGASWDDVFPSVWPFRLCRRLPAHAVMFNSLHSVMDRVTRRGWNIRDAVSHSLLEMLPPQPKHGMLRRPAQ